MTTSNIASTALDFLATIAPDDPIWDLDSIEVFVSHVQSLATQKRHERTHGINHAMDALRAEIAMLPDGDLDIGLGVIEGADVSSLDASLVVPRIDVLTAAIASYRQEVSRTSDGNPRTIAERAAIYQAMGASLTVIENNYAKVLECLTPARADPGPVTIAKAPDTRQEITATRVPSDVWVVAYFLARYGHRTGTGPAEPPSELGEVNWKDAYYLFHPRLSDGSGPSRFWSRLKNCRDKYARYVDSGRRGWNVELARTAEEVLNEWQDRSREVLWEYVKQFVTR